MVSAQWEEWDMEKANVIFFLITQTCFVIHSQYEMSQQYMNYLIAQATICAAIGNNIRMLKVN